MSILIKGAKMPKSCDKCDFIAYDDEYEYECWCPIIRSNVEEYTENKPARCPLVEIPSADVVEVKHGEWIYGESEEGHDGYRCSECGEFIPWEYDEYDVDFIKEAHYCPNCGARMDGKGRDHE